MIILKLICSSVRRTILNSSYYHQIRPTNHERCFRGALTSTRRQRMSSGDGTKDNANDCISLTFLKPDGKKVTVRAKQNKSLYDAVIDNNVDIDGFGACEGTLCCTTCHLVFKQSDYEKVGEPSDEELDMLDLAYGLTDTSRLGCQVFLKKELDPLEVQVPASINDVRES